MKKNLTLSFSVNLVKYTTYVTISRNRRFAKRGEVHFI